MQFNIKDFGIVDTEEYAVEPCLLDEGTDDTCIQILDKAVLDRLTNYVRKFYNVVEATVYTDNLTGERYICVRIDKRDDVVEIIDDMLWLDVLDSEEQV